MRLLGRPVFWLSSRPVAIGAENVPSVGACLVAATHASPYDIPLLIRHTRRLVDFVSIVEVFRNPLVAWFYGSLNAFPLDRSRADPKTVRTIVGRLERGRCVGIFPEGGFRRGNDSVVYSRKIRPGIGRIAQMTGAPVVPCVIVDSALYCRPASWLPVRRTRYGIIYGEPIDPRLDPHSIESALVDAYVAMHARLTAAMLEP
ncbi:MAG TPA: lysophospholipid acyltransferase family protein [Phycisphaerales bacterium]|nr:lysophospholipid acyltransferase family protein [Phycisphaerales bacterium]